MSAPSPLTTILTTLTLLGLLIPTISTVAAINKLRDREYGEFCSATANCNRSAWLNCQDGLCVCVKSEEMQFDPLQGKCVFKPGERCKFQNSGNIFEGTDCVANAICGSSGRCEPKREYLEPCANSNECKTGLGCWNATCTCEPNHSKWSKVNVDAAVVAGDSQIVKSGTCVHKSTRWAGGIQSPNYPNKYDNNENCTFQITAPPHLKIKFKMLDYYTECDVRVDYDFVYIYDGNTTEEASRLLNPCKSNSSTTVLSSGNQMRVHFKTDGSNVRRGWRGRIELFQRDFTFECVGVANKQCSQNQNCVEHAKCSLERQCVCKEDYAVTSKGECGLSHGKNCDANEKVCSDSFICSDGKCACRHPSRQIYNVGRDKCTSFVSGLCATDKDCIDGTFCNINAKTGLGFCECEAGGIENSKWTCDLAHGSVCQNSTLPCDSVAGLKCQNGLCSCPDDSMLFSTVDQMCLGLVHFRCSKEDGCVENAECVVVRKGLSGVCKCKDGFEEARDRTCIPSASVLRKGK